mgnify:CR=1 FL=1
MNKYWRPIQNFTILGFREPEIKLKDNFRFETMGDNLDDSTPWHQALTPYFKTISDDYFFLAFEDHFLIDYVNIGLFNEAENIIKNDKTIGKVRLLPKYGQNDPQQIKIYNGNFYESIETTAQCSTTSLRPSIWRKDFFIKLLNNTNIKSPHHFEVVNLGKAFSQRVILPKGNDPVFPDLDAMRKGSPNAAATKDGLINAGYYSLNLKEEDLGVFQSVKKKWNSRG